MTTPYTATSARLGTDERDSIPEFEAATNKVIETLIDGIRDFDAAAEKASGELASQFAAMRDQRRTTTEDMIRIAADEDMRPVTLDDQGTPTGALHRTWIAVRDAVEGDSGLVDAAVTGEEHAKSELDEVLEGNLPDALAAITRRAFGEIDSNITQLGNMKS